MEVLIRQGGRSARVGRGRFSGCWLALLALCGPRPPAAAAGSALQTAPPAADRLALDQAIELALAHDPNIGLAESRLATARGVLLAARGAFDPTLTSALVHDRDVLPGGAESETLSTTVGVSQRLRYGLVVSPQVDLERREDGGPALNQAVVSIDLRQPLLRGRGRQATAAVERSAERLVEAGRLDLEQAVAERLRAVIAQYWSVIAALEDLEILRTTEESSRRLLETTRRLIEADLTPAAEAVLLEADLAARESDRLAGERFLYQARLDLGREIGLAPAAIALLPTPGDPFPTVDVADLPAADAAGELTELALGVRADLKAARRRLAASEALLAAAENALQPQLDLVLVPSYTGEITGDGDGDFLRPLVDQIPGVSTEVGISLSWPTLNRRAEGDLLQARSAFDQSRLVAELTVRQIGADVPIALDAARRVALQVAIAERAVGLFGQAVTNEEKKLRAGNSTLIDVISQRDRLTSSRRQLVAARLDLALALLELRFQTGTLVVADDERYAVRVEDVISFPDHAL